MRWPNSVKVEMGVKFSPEPRRSPTGVTMVSTKPSKPTRALRAPMVLWRAVSCWRVRWRNIRRYEQKIAHAARQTQSAHDKIVSQRYLTADYTDGADGRRLTRLYLRNPRSSSVGRKSPRRESREQLPRLFR